MGSLAEERPRAMHLADILKALAHPARLRIVAALCEGKESVIGLAERLDLKQAIVSQQLRILRMCSLVEATRENGFSLYGLAEPRLRELVACLDGCRREGMDEGKTGAGTARNAAGYRGSNGSARGARHTAGNRGREGEKR
jgi:DNA-binding transcriptional ArsR family regulator